MASVRLLILLCIVVFLSQLLRSDAARLESGASLDEAATPSNSSFCDSSCKDPKRSSFDSVLCMFCGLAKHSGSEPLESVAEPAEARKSPEECKEKCQPGSAAYFSEACSSCRISVLPVLPADDAVASVVVSLPKDYSLLCSDVCSSSSMKNTYFCKICRKAKSPAPAPAAPPTKH